MNPLRPSDQISLKEQAKLDKELINSIEPVIKPPDKSACGIDKPCTFGKHNKNFDKNKSL